MKRWKIAAIMSLLLVFGDDPAEAQGHTCGLALVLSTDVSSSIDAGEYHLQMNGLARAFRSRRLRDALLGLSKEPVVATVVQWSGYDHQTQDVPWTRLDSEEAISRFATATANIPRGPEINRPLWPRASNFPRSFCTTCHADEK